MSASVRRWLPPGTVSPALDRDVATLAAEWAQAWFGFGLAAEGGLRSDPVDLRGALHVLGADVAIGMSGAALGELALGLKGGERSAADRALLDRVGDAVREDLQRRVRTGITRAQSDWSGPVERLDWTPVRWQRFSDGAGRLALTLAFGERCFVDACLDRLPAPPARRPLTPLSQAVAGREVRLSARLGRCTLQLAEMRGMVVGDTLLFNASVDAALPVVLDGAATAIAAARVVREPAQWTLHLETSDIRKAA